ncbi:MAG: CBS domain-containing protein [Candidatus Thiodiazotropha sp. (ex Monitilora ramsayi)]|nr:CBS domain-containing protein [Candidatus Thiodiazotropha sp. (ex Monitilora ramsayi)]
MSEEQVIRVRDVMKPDFDMVDGMDTVETALGKNMLHVETKCLIVKKRNPDDEFGLVMLSDIARQVLAVDRAPERVNIYEIMTKPAFTVSPDMDIRYCARIFSRFDLSRAPVVENGEVVGIVSYTDMVLKGLKRKRHTA